ncbi:hypothetical protein Gotri_027499, partial [Gossypium trilobum]|nr:hypothetical protein [Gossypium trilobum]
VNVFVTPRETCEFYNAPYYEFDFVEESDLEYFMDINMDSIINYLTKGRDECKHHLEETSMHRDANLPLHEKMY